MDDRNQIEVLLGTDGRGMFMAHITIASLLNAAKGDRKIRINLMIDGFDEAMKEAIRGEVAKHPFASVRFIEVAEVLGPYIETLKACMGGCAIGSGALMTWGRCFCDVLLPDVTGRLVYLDTDTYVADDIAKLADAELDGKVFGAVPESTPTSKESWLHRLGLADKCAFYFCAGVMVFDMAEYRRLGGSKKLMEVVEANRDRIFLADQDALNYFAGGNVKSLHPRWNYNDGWVEKQFRFRLDEKDYRGRKPSEMMEAIFAPGVIHYQNKNKPWRFNHRPEGRRYERLMRATGYLKGRYLPGSGFGKELVRSFFDAYHWVLVQVAKLRYAAWSRKAAKETDK